MNEGMIPIRVSTLALVFHQWIKNPKTPILLPVSLVFAVFYITWDGYLNNTDTLPQLSCYFNALLSERFVRSNPLPFLTFNIFWKQN